MGAYWDLLKVARFLSPFAYFDPVGAAISGMSWTECLVLGGITAVSIPAAFLSFGRQDL